MSRARSRLGKSFTRLALGNALVATELCRLLPNSISKMQPKVNSLWLSPRIVIALHSPNAMFETGLRMCLPEKSQDSNRIRCRAVRSLQSGLFGNNREIRALFAYFSARRAEFLCRADCVAEGEEFELSVPFPAMPLRALVSATYRDSIASANEPEKRILSVHKGEVVRFLRPVEWRRPGDHRHEGTVVEPLRLSKRLAV
jgi:hypothetical protein